MIVKVGAAGSYALNKLDGNPVPRMWNPVPRRESIKFSYSTTPRCGSKLVGTFKSPDVAPSLLALSKAHIWI